MNNKALNAFLLILSQAVNVIIVFLFTPYLVRALPKEIYGSYSQVLFISEFIGILTSLAITQIAMMFFTRTEFEFSDYLKTILVFTLGAGLVGFVLCLGFSVIAPTIFDNPILGVLLKIYAFNLIGTKVNQVLNQAMIKLNETKKVMLISIGSNFTKLTLALISIKLYHSIEMLLWIYALEPIVSAAIQYFILYHKNLMNGKFRRPIFMEIFSIGIPLYLVEILGASYTYIAGFIIGINLNQTQYAIYRNGSFELPVIGTIYGTISLIFMGDLSKYIQEGNFSLVAKIKKKIITSTAVIIFPIAVYFIFFSKEFILLYMSEKYIESYKVFIVFTMALLIRLQNYTDVLILMKKSRYVLLSFAVFLVLNVVLNVSLSFSLGIIGCALATIISVVVLAFMQLHITIKELAVKYIDFIDFSGLLKILIICILWIGAIKGISYFIHSRPIIILSISVVICLPTLYIYLLKKKFADITQFKSIFEKIPILGPKLYNYLQ